MKKKPILIQLIAAGLFLVPFVYLAHFVFYVKVPIQNFSAFTTWSFIGLAAISFLVGYAVWQVYTWGFYALLAFSLVTICLETYVWLVRDWPFNYLLILDLFVAILAIVLIVQKTIRKPYLDPKIRWWLTPERHATPFSGLFKNGEQQSVANILDISTTGCFAGLNLPAEIGSLFEVEINFNSIRFVTQAELVRSTDQGAGLKFSQLDFATKRTLKKMIQSLSEK